MYQTDRTGLSQNVGNEFDLTITLNGQLVADFGLLETRERKVNATLIETIPANNNAVPVRRVTFHGFTFSCSYVRQDDTLDDFVDALIAAYQASAQQYQMSAYETVINNGHASQWSYRGGVIVPESLGNIKGPDKVDGVTFALHFGERNKVRGPSNAPSLNVSPVL